MPCSLLIYRQRIGRFNSGLAKTKSYRKSGGREIMYFRNRMTISILIAFYCSLIVSVPVLVQQHQAQAVHGPLHYSHGGGTAGCGQFEATDGNLGTGWSCAAMSGYVWDPGPACMSSDYTTQWVGVDTEDSNNSNSTAVFTWTTKVGINKLAHILNGNRNQRGKGITCAYWNKGPSLLKNKQLDIKTLLEDHKPHILGLGEANFKYGHDIEDVAIEGYNLHLDSALGNSELGSTARVAVYTHELLRVKRRHDLEDDKVAAIWLECGLPHQKGVLVCMGYRQWRLLGQADDRSASVTEQLARWSTFVGK